MMVLSQQKNTGIWREVSLKSLANFCLQVCGGGYTEEQTADAMAMQRRILDGHEYESPNGLRIIVVERVKP